MVVRLIYLGLATVWWAATVFRARKSAVVLCYHAVTAAQKSKFLWQMKTLRNQSINPDQLVAGNFGVNSVCVTFDDAFECLIRNAVPVAEECGVDITIFAVSENMGEAPKWGMDDNRGDTNELIMTYDQLADVSKNPRCIIGSHTATHPKLASLSKEQLNRELGGSREQLASNLGVAIDYLAFPHGSYNDLVTETSREAGYKAVFSLDELCITPKGNEYVLGRFSASPDMWPIEFVLTVKGAYSWLYGWRRLLRRVRKRLSGSA